MSERAISGRLLRAGSPVPATFSAQYTSSDGRSVPSAAVRIAYHQCRWNYKSTDDVATSMRALTRTICRMTCMWLDIEHTEAKKYFTWDKVRRGGRVGKQLGRHLQRAHVCFVFVGLMSSPTSRILPPGRSAQRQGSSHGQHRGSAHQARRRLQLHQDATAAGHYVKKTRRAATTRDGAGREGERKGMLRQYLRCAHGFALRAGAHRSTVCLLCSRSRASYLDFFQQRVRDFWAGLFALRELRREARRRLFIWNGRLVACAAASAEAMPRSRGFEVVRSRLLDACLQT